VILPFFRKRFVLGDFEGQMYLSSSVVVDGLWGCFFCCGKAINPFLCSFSRLQGLWGAWTGCRGISMRGPVCRGTSVRGLTSSVVEYAVFLGL